MYKYFSIPLLLWVCNASAGLEAIGVYPFTSFCFNNGLWDDSCANPPSQGAGYGSHKMFYSKDTNELVAFGSYGNQGPITAVCKSTTDKNWVDCSPSADTVVNFPVEQHYAHDGNGSFMVVGTGLSKLHAACRDASGKWMDCSPVIYNGKFGKPTAIGYGNGQWMVLGSTYATRGEDDKEAKVYTAFCMDADTKIWTNCDKKVHYTPATSTGGSMYGLVYLENEELWVATGVTFAFSNPSEPAANGHLVSLCMKESDPIATDCSGDELLTLDLRYINHLTKNDEGHLLLIGTLFIHTPDDLLESPQLLCRASNSTWENCTGNLPQTDPNDRSKNYRYVSATVDDENNWVLIGEHMDKYTDKIDYLTAIGKNDDWTMISQEASPGVYLSDVCFVD